MGRTQASWITAFPVHEQRCMKYYLSSSEASVKNEPCGPRLGAFKARGASPFEDMNATVDQRTSNRTGFYRNGRNGKRTFMVLPKAFRREVSNGFDAKILMQALLACG
jgi:hypothetical protein